MSNITLKKYLYVSNIEADGDDEPITEIRTEEIEACLMKSYESSRQAYDTFTKKYVAQKGDIMYFDSSCTVPRFKLKAFCDKYDVSVSKGPDKATVIFMGPDAFNDYFNRDSVRVVHVNFYKELIHKVFPAGHEKGLALLSQLENYQEDVVLLHSYDSYYSISNHELLEPLIDSYGEEAFRDEYVLQKNDKCDVKFDILTDPRVFKEDEIIKYINVDNVMDEESYNNVRSLFESSDSGNHMLGMEIMANCDYKRSAVYLLLLFSEYSNAIYNSPSRKHVNFKSLIKFFNLNMRGHYSLTDILNTLKTTKLATPENIEMVIKFKKQDLVSHDAEDHFVVQTIVPNSESKQAIQESIVDKAIEENLPYSEEEIADKVKGLVFNI